MRRPDWYVKQVRERTSIAGYASKRLTFDRRKSKPQAGDYWAPCPFHTEKSASFHVLDRQGIFKCFGCGESGDVFTLCQKLEGLSFVEAIDKLGSEAGLQPPESTPGEREAMDRRGRLLKLMARADELYRKALHGPEGKAAREYLQKRDLGPEVWAQFSIGLAPDNWTWALDTLAKDGFTRDELIAVGLAKEGGRNGAIDVFRNRVLFPITDSQGRTVAFGGRALAKDEPAKYLNSPETEIFHKGAMLYRLREARELLAKTKGAGFVVAEGYLDVAAFERAGVPAVAPMGTALTEEQLALAWRSGAEPILCFDGDAAGLRAADRALELALPHLGPERTVRIAVLPPGLDPDDVFRKSGPEALVALLAHARPAVEALFEREKTRRDLETPEARADLKKRLMEAAGRIAHEETRKQYLRALTDSAWKLFAPAPRATWTPGQNGDRNGGKWSPRGKGPPPARATDALKRLAPLSQDRRVEHMVRQPVDYPFILAHGADLFAQLPIEDRELDAIRHAILDLWSESKTVDREALSHHLLAAGWETAQARISQWPPPMARKPLAAKLGEGRPDASPASEMSPGAPPAGAPGTAGLGVDETLSAAEKAVRDEIEADWMALLAFDVTAPLVDEEYREMRGKDFDADADAFETAMNLLRSGRSVRETAILRSRGETPVDENLPDGPRSDDRAA
jgi:DNA primase